MGEWVIGTTKGDLKGLSQGSIPPFPTKNQRVSSLMAFEYRHRRVRGLGVSGLRGFGVSGFRGLGV